MKIRPETPADAPAIRALTTAAFLDAEHGDGNEAAIVDRLRDGGALAVSLVAEQDGALVGHAAFSPVTIGGRPGWYGLGPVSVRADRRRQGIAGALIEAGLLALKARGAGGCVVLGNPAYYGRFGFACDPAVTLAGIPPGFFMRLRFRGGQPAGAVAYHPAFGV
ncbi:N-acetyltransferase [Roseomonas sp. NAR14]|uniref:N-acetyltransferase n=1 Tax=Roseomonas acroporae TaxID=2937791 RepID=A0A9X1Y6U3_9PROT|nr:N-acetyltransferase [Roseomonas acroporae]MCK8785049.1 N-acetyltransferase [Roseomonas acroporae]